MTIIKGNSIYNGVVEWDEKIVCEKCFRADRCKIIMHLDGTKEYTTAYACECGNQISITTKRDGDDLMMWQDDDEEVV